MNNFYRNKALKSPSVKFNLVIRSKNKLTHTSILRQRFVKFHSSIRTKSKKIITQKKFPKSEKNLPTIPYINILRKKWHEREIKNERKRQYILLKIKHDYSKKAPSNYYKMVISNLLSSKQNRLKTKYTELLNLIDTKELLSNYFLLKESKIKVLYLTKLFANNIRIFPNYILNEKIYNIMSNYLIEKERLIKRIENNTRLNVLKEKLLKYMNKEKESEEIEITKNKKGFAIDSFSYSGKLDLEENLNDINVNNNSFDYSFGERNDSINKVKNLINDISTFLNSNNVDNIEDNGKIVKESKIKFKSNYLNKKPLNLKILKDEKYEIKKTITENKPFSFNEKKIIKNLIFSNLAHKKKEKYLKIPPKKADNLKQVKFKYNKANKYILNNEKINNNFYKNFQTIPNQRIDNNIYLSTTKVNGNTNTVRTLSGTSNRKNNFKPTNKFLNYKYQNEIKEKAKIKTSILDFVKKFGLSKNNNETTKPKVILNKENISGNSNKLKHYSINSGFILSNNKENKNIFGLLDKKNYSRFFLPEKFISDKKNTDVSNKKNINYLLTQTQSERIELNLKRLKKNKNNWGKKIIKDK